ncbi:hypothetical protein [Arsenicibacter rosenii]|uniref:DUF1772 domain-containing protein n=1 Tax=Arsenicibacter rosenii TaxID=1750698 RepID=A0A1S2VPB3_9BACT|nr:hypothetical protein [Arsenicibacter rosenii]OIN60607.1 hypothetical protein BLX24_00330 [Arsenicibacter rosenii]
MTAILLPLFVLNLAMAFGAGLYETRIVLPRWFPESGGRYAVDREAMMDLESGRHFWGFVTTGPLTMLTLANLALAWQSLPPVHDWWMAASLAALAERVGTFTFFIPAAMRLQRGNKLKNEVLHPVIRRWIQANYLRNLLTLAACLLALKALMLV